MIDLQAWRQRSVAVLVLFRTETLPLALMQALAETLGALVVVDNCPTGHPVLAETPLLAGETRLRNGNQGGLAGAYNAALRWLQAQPLDAWSHVVFVDEDSDIEGLRSLMDSPASHQLAHRSDTAAIAPAYRERATGLRGQYLQPLVGWSLHFWPREFDGIRPVSFLINSMSCWQRSALERIGPFDEALGVDHIDTDYCLRARTLGLQLMVDGDQVFLHSIGQRQAYRLLGRQLQTGGHSPGRRYQIARNTLWLMRRHGRRYPAFALLGAARIGYELVGIVAAESQRLTKWAAVWRGVWAGLFSRVPRVG